MRYLRNFSTCLVAIALSSAAWAEIYETTDAEGNPEFTNSPAGADAKVVEVPPTNIVGDPEPEQQAQEQAQQPETMSGQQASQQQPQQENNPVIIDDGGANEVYDDALRKQREFERMDPAAPHEVGDTNSQMPHEVGDFPAEMPQEEGDFPNENENVYDPAEHRGINQGHPERMR